MRNGSTIVVVFVALTMLGPMPDDANSASKAPNGSGGLGLTKEECSAGGDIVHPDVGGEGHWGCCDKERAECWICKGEVAGGGHDHCKCVGKDCPTLPDPYPAMLTPERPGKPPRVTPVSPPQILPPAPGPAQPTPPPPSPAPVVK